MSFDNMSAITTANTSEMFSSGDTGVGSACLTNDGKNTTRFLPIFPAACSYVTSVGATRYVEPEVAVSFSSGGLSDHFPRPEYKESESFSTTCVTHGRACTTPTAEDFPMSPHKASGSMSSIRMVARQNLTSSLVAPLPPHPLSPQLLLFSTMLGCRQICRQ